MKCYNNIGDNVYTLKRLKKIRKESNITIYDMARMLGITASFYSQLENGKRRLFYDTAVKISTIFNLCPDEIFYVDRNNIYDE